jgi:hypothetical protein
MASTQAIQSDLKAYGTFHVVTLAYRVFSEHTCVQTAPTRVLLLRYARYFAIFERISNIFAGRGIVGNLNAEAGTNGQLIAHLECRPV